MGRQNKDQKLLVTLKKMAEGKGDLYHAFHFNEIAEESGLSPKSVKTIVALLAQANFVKKAGKQEIYFTDHGLKLVEELVQR